MPSEAGLRPMRVGKQAPTCNGASKCSAFFALMWIVGAEETLDFHVRARHPRKRSHTREPGRSAIPGRSRDCIALDPQAMRAFDPDLDRAVHENSGRKVYRVRGNGIVFGRLKGPSLPIQSPFDHVGHSSIQPARRRNGSVDQRLFPFRRAGPAMGALCAAPPECAVSASAKAPRVVLTLHQFRSGQ